MKGILGRLFAGESLGKDEAKAILLRITANEFPSAQVAAFLTAYQMRKITVDELEGFRDALLERAVPLDLSPYEPVDLCGTGGDEKHTFNISTTASFVAAGAGTKVAKHGNYGASSTCGSSNLLEALRIPFPASHTAAKQMLDCAGICFLHAPLWHPAMKSVGQLRKELGFKTFFNILGPLVNPCKPRHQLVGVYSVELFELYSALFHRTNKEYLLVHSIDGYDEVSLTGPTRVRSPKGEDILSPETFGFHHWKAGHLKGGDTVEDAAKLCMSILSGDATPAQREVVIANAALAIKVVHPKMTLADCVGKASESLDGGHALRVLQNLQRERA